MFSIHETADHPMAIIRDVDQEPREIRADKLRRRLIFSESGQ